MRCKYLEDGQCKNDADVLYSGIGICAEHAVVLSRLIESKGNVPNLINIEKRRPTKRAPDGRQAAVIIGQ